MADTRRIPGLGAILAFAFLIVSMAAVTWWLNRPRSDIAPPASPVDLEVVCLGRVDGQASPIGLEPNVPGKVVRVWVTEGQVIKEKDELFRLDDEAATLRSDEAKAAVAAAEIDVRLAELDRELHPMRKELQKASIIAAETRAAAARKIYLERETGKSFGTVTPAELTTADAEARQLEHRVEVERAKLSELDKLEPSLRVEAAKAKVVIAQATQKQAEKSVRDCVLRSPVGGVVLRINAAVGESVAPGSPQPALILRPAGPLVIRAELEQEFIPRVKPGMKATIQDDVRTDSPTWTGTVRQVGGWVARKRSVLLDPGEVNDVRTVECVIALDGNTDGLLIGQRMRVRIGK